MAFSVYRRSSGQHLKRPDGKRRRDSLPNAIRITPPLLALLVVSLLPSVSSFSHIRIPIQRKSSLSVELQALETKDAAAETQMIDLHPKEQLPPGGAFVAAAIQAQSDDDNELVLDDDGGGGDVVSKNRNESDRTSENAVRNRAMKSVLTKSTTPTPTKRSVRKDSTTTSVGARRIKSASRARAGSRRTTTSQLLTSVRRAAAAKVAAGAGAGHNNNSTRISRTVVDSCIESLIQRNAGIDHDPPAMGLLGSKTIHPLLKHPAPGTILVQSDKLLVRLATILDDLDIAALRLSVFADFLPDVRKQFLSRSKQVLANRRSRGATCLVVTSSEKGQQVLGSVECSIHEFYETLLGQRRQESSVLYITEVAVNPLHRRCGIGTKLLQGVDELGKCRNIESIYLHVDVNNNVALTLYEKCGYCRVPMGEEEMYGEFTASLNLHDGATKGRKHYLLCKHLKPPTWM